MFDDTGHVTMQFDVAGIRLEHHLIDVGEVVVKIFEFFVGCDRGSVLFDGFQSLVEIVDLFSDIMMLTVQFCKTENQSE